MKQWLALGLILVGCSEPIVRDSDAGGSDATPEPCLDIEVPQCSKAEFNEETGKCKIVPETTGVPCDDGLFCTVGDECRAGQCVGADENHCEMTPGECQGIRCNEETDSCKEVASPDGAECDTLADKCQTGGTCQGGKCVGVQKDCSFAPMPDNCHVGECNPETGKCDPIAGNDGESCQLADALCQVGTCDDGVCEDAEPLDCSDWDDDCSTGTCDPTTGDCTSEPLAVGTECEPFSFDETCQTEVGACDATGYCEPVALADGTACDDGGVPQCFQGKCLSGACDYVPIENGDACEDGNACTTGETCDVGGTCGGGVYEAPTVYFAEDFSDNTAAWTLGTDWQIGAAVKSSTSEDLCCDPDSDTSPSGDDGVAGVLIGDVTGSGLHDLYYLESPAVDLTGVTSAQLGFYRWLMSDGESWMNNTVEVFNGTTWVVLWEGYAEDIAWTFESYDVSAYANAAFKVRFGYEVVSSGAYDSPSWTIDDVVVASKACPAP